MITYFCRRALGLVVIHFLLGYKNNKSRQTKIQLKLARKRFENNYHKVMKAIRSQLKRSNMFMITHKYIGGHLDWHYSVLYAVTKRTTNRDYKISKKKMRENASKAVDLYFAPQNMFN